MAEKSPYPCTFDVNHPSFMAPESMQEALKAFLVAKGCPEPFDMADYFNSAYHSLAEGYKEAINDLEINTGRRYPAIYIVGGGAKNKYLNALTEKYTGKKVIALPIEATAIGNIMIQIKRSR